MVRVGGVAGIESRIEAIIAGGCSTYSPGTSANEIVDLRCMATRSVEMGRDHSHQKMKLLKGVSLITFLASLWIGYI
jgi:hypothetical protein